MRWNITSAETGHRLTYFLLCIIKFYQYKNICGRITRTEYFIIRMCFHFQIYYVCYRQIVKILRTNLQLLIILLGKTRENLTTILPYLAFIYIKSTISWEKIYSKMLPQWTSTNDAIFSYISKVSNKLIHSIEHTVSNRIEPGKMNI